MAACSRSATEGGTFFHLRLMLSRPIAVLLLFAPLAACDQPAADAPSDEVPPQRGLDFVPSSELDAVCRSAASLRSMCPTLLPESEGVPEITGPERLGGRTLLSVSVGAPYPGLRRRNAPPAFLHLVISSGPDAPFPAGPPSEIERIEEIHHFTNAPMDLGVRHWGGLVGRLFLAPDYPGGGIEGGHLVFAWNDDPQHPAVSIHAWFPLEDAELTLEGVVGSTMRG